MSGELKTLTLRVDEDFWKALKLFSIDAGKPVTKIMRDALSEAISKKKPEESIEQEMCALTELQDKALQLCGISFSCYRAVTFILNNQGSNSETIKERCKISNLSDSIIGLRGVHTRILSEMGLSVVCHPPRGSNASWRVEVTDANKWESAQLMAQENPQGMSYYLSIAVNKDAA